MALGYYSKYYNTQQWRKIRAYIIQESIKKYGNATCEYCGKAITTRSIVNHKKPVPMEWQEDFNFFDLNNLELLHLGCHNSLTLNDTGWKINNPNRARHAKQTSFEEHLVQEESPLDKLFKEE